MPGGSQGYLPTKSPARPGALYGSLTAKATRLIRQRKAPTAGPRKQWRPVRVDHGAIEQITLWSARLQVLVVFPPQLRRPVLISKTASPKTMQPTARQVTPATESEDPQPSRDSDPSPPPWFLAPGFAESQPGTGGREETDTSAGEPGGAPRRSAGAPDCACVDHGIESQEAASASRSTRWYCRAGAS